MQKETKTDLVADAVQHIKSLREALSSIMDERNRLDNEVLQLKTLLQRVRSLLLSLLPSSKFS